MSMREGRKCNMLIKETLFNNLNYLMKINRYNVDEMASQLNKSSDEIMLWKDANDLPSVLEFSEIADFYGLGLDELLLSVFNFDLSKNIVNITSNIKIGKDKNFFIKLDCKRSDLGNKVYSLLELIVSCMFYSGGTRITRNSNNDFLIHLEEDELIECLKIDPSKKLRIDQLENLFEGSIYINHEEINLDSLINHIDLVNHDTHNLVLFYVDYDCFEALKKEIIKIKNSLISFRKIIDREVEFEKMGFISKHEIMMDLPNSLIVSIIIDYYANVKISDIRAKYNLTKSSSSFHKILPRITFESKCEKCGGRLYTELPSKSYVGFQIEKCEDCGHFKNNYCTCSYCMDELNKSLEVERVLKEEQLMQEESRERKKELEKRNKLIQYCKGRRPEKVREDSLSLKDKLYLSVFIRSYLSDDWLELVPIVSNDTYKRVSPDLEFTYGMLNELRNRNILIISPQSPIDAFHEENFPERVHIGKVSYLINITAVDNYNDMIKRLINIKDNKQLFNKSDVIDIWREVAYYESLQYFKYRLCTLDLGEITVGEKTKKLIYKLVDNYSVSEAYWLLYRHSQNALTYYTENSVTRERAINWAVSSLGFYLDKMIANSWDATSYHRSNELPISVISEVFFYEILDINELGFYECSKFYV